MRSKNRFYEIAVTFPTMAWKGVEEGRIPGLSPDRFCPEDLWDFLCNGKGGAWSSGEKLVLNFLLNLYSPGAYDGFNLGYAMNTWDEKHVQACLKALARIYSGD